MLPHQGPKGFFSKPPTFFLITFDSVSRLWFIKPWSLLSLKAVLQLNLIKMYRQTFLMIFIPSRAHALQCCRKRGALLPPVFDRSDNPISTKGGRADYAYHIIMCPSTPPPSPAPGFSNLPDSPFSFVCRGNNFIGVRWVVRFHI